jgi:hypothetical protein
MEVIKTLNAGSAGTKRYQQQYGSKLICVRYRKDVATNRRITTVEIVVEDLPLQATKRQPERISRPVGKTQRVLLRIGYEEEKLRERVRQAGGWWMPKEKLWRLPIQAVEALKLQSRVVRPAD